MYNGIINFIRDTFNEEKAFIPLHVPRFYGNERKYVLDSIDSTYVSSVGTYVDLFEEKLAELTGAKYAIAIVNGTSALHLALDLAGVGRGDEVLTQALTFVATANAISYSQAIPHFVDVDKETMGLSPSLLKKHLQKIAVLKNGVCYNKETNNRIAACVPMHTFGQCMYIDELKVLCDQYNIPVVEDAAESLGSYYKKKHTGTFGLLGVFSFNGNKIVTAGGGGAIVTNDENLAKKAKHLSTQAKIPHQWEYRHDSIGFNYRLPNLNAALVCGQLEQLESYRKNKRELAELYRDYFKNYNWLRYFSEIENSESNYWLNTIVLEKAEQRNKFLKFMNENGIMTRPIWSLLNNLDMYKDHPKADLSNSEWLENRAVNLPSSVRL